MHETPQPQILPMHHDHLEAVLAIEQQVHDRPWSARLFATELDQPGRRYVTAWGQQDGQRRLLGYGGVLLAVDEAHITNVAVDPRARRRQVGSHLVLALLESALDMGATAATLEVGSTNLPAQRLYASFGFAPVGVRPRYYAATGEDAIIMWAHDLDGADAAALLRRRGAELRAGSPLAPEDRAAASPATDREVVG